MGVSQQPGASLFAHRRVIAFIRIFSLLIAIAALTGCSGVKSKSSTPALAIATTTLPDAQTGAAYSSVLAATGGASPYIWSLASGALPNGLSLNATTGAISGTPTAPVSATPLTFKVTDSTVPTQSATASLTLNVLPAVSGNPLAITTTSLPSGQVGVAYSAPLYATGGATPYTWALTGGALPTGLSLNASTGAITGTPTAPANGISLTFAISDSSSPAQSASVTLSLTIGAAPASLAITSTELPNGKVGAPYTWTLTNGSLPSGLTLNASTGAVTGTPTVTANATALTFTVTDASNPAQSASVHLTLNVAAANSPAPLSITTTSLPAAQVGTAYNSVLATTGGTAPYIWTVNPSLPSGLSLNTSTGAITGTPTATANAVSFTFMVTDSSSSVQSASARLTLTIAGSTSGLPLAISTTTLPNGQQGNAYSTAMVATGGSLPYTWSVASGSLPAGLLLNAATGAITGTPTATATASPLTLSVSDSSVPVQTKSVSLALTVYATNGITVSVSPQNTGLTITQTLSLTATTTDSEGVTWSATGPGCSGAACGSFSSTTSQSGVAVTYTAPSTAGVYTIAAASVTNSSVNASATIGVTDLAGVTTYHNDLARDGANTQEYALTPTNVQTNFGKLFSCTVDESIYAQPLWMPNVSIGGVKHNVVFVATQNDSVYAFDADTNTTPCTPLWHANLLDTQHGANPGEAPVPSAPGGLVGGGTGDIEPVVGITGTPVIDPTTNTLYVVAKSYVSGPTFYQRLHALDIATGSDRVSPASIDASVTYPGSGDGTATTTFSPRQENQRPGLALNNGIVYVAWASHEDEAPFYGWIVGYGASDLSLRYILNIAPNGSDGGIWMSGGAPAIDPSSGLIYLLTANGTFDASNASPPNNDYSDSLLALSPSLTVGDYFTPNDQQHDQTNDVDFGAGGAAVLVTTPGLGMYPAKLVIGGGKDGNLYVLDGNNLGGFGDDFTNTWQRLQVSSGGIFSTGAYWNSTFYLSTVNKPIYAYTLGAGTAKLTQRTDSTTGTYGWPGATPSISSAPDFSNGIVWALDNHFYCSQQSKGCGPALLHAYDATNLATELWNNTLGTGNTGGNPVKFTVPTVANGKVYVGTRGNNQGGADSSTSIPGELDVYGLLN
jgi:hypothetical protein